MTVMTGNLLLERLRGLVAQSGLVAGAVLVNAALFALAGWLTTQQRTVQDITDPVGVSLVNLAPPEPPKQEEVSEPEPPPPAQEKPDFAPDLIQPSISGPGVGDLAISVDIGDVARGNAAADMIFDSVDLDQAPQAVSKVPPTYPYKAREQGVEGYVAVKFLVREDGSVGNVNILKAKPEGYFEDEVRRALLRWNFQPGKIAGEPVASWVLTTLRFDLN
jgi:protein TonB